MLEIARRPLRAAAITAAIAGAAYLLLHPPSFSGAAGLAAFLVGAAGIALFTAWVVVRLTGHDAISEERFERIVVRSEQLARQSEAYRAGVSEFDHLVAEAIDRLPDEFRRLLEDTPVVVSRLGSQAGAYGHYFGDTVARDHHEDRIVLYEDTLERDFGWDRDLLAAQIERTLRHELAHHLGWGEPGVRSLGL